MSKSRHNKRQKSNMPVKKSPSSTKKARKPLKCKINIIDSFEPRKNSLKKCKPERKSTFCESNQKSFLKSKKNLRSSPRLSLLLQPKKISIPEKNVFKSQDSNFKIIDSVEIDVLSNFIQSNKKISSSSRESDEIQLADVMNADKNISKHKKNLDKLSVISPLKQNWSPCRKKRKSFYRQSNLGTQYCKSANSKMPKNDMDSKMITPKTSELPENLLRSLNSMVLRSTQKDKRVSNDELGMKKIRKSISVSKNQRIDKTKKAQSLPSKLKKAMQKNKVTNLVLRHFEKSKIDINYESPKAVELATNIHSSRDSMTLRTRHSSEKTPVLRNIQMPDINNKSLEAVELFTSSSRSSMTLRTRHNSEKLPRNSMILQSGCNSEKPNRNRISLQTRHHYKNVSNNLLSDETVVALVSRKKLSENDLKLNECSVTLSDVRKETQIEKSPFSLKKQKAVVENEKNARKRLPSSLIKAKTPIQKRRKSSVKFKKQVRPRSFSAFIPIDCLALAPAITRNAKSDGYKFSARKTLKRKRFIIEEIKKADDGYEDDIYESKSFDHFKDMFPDSSDSSDLSCVIQTPKLASSLTPAIRCTTPVYKDCFSPTEYALNRKIAEDYIYRNRKKKRTSQETPDVPEKKKLEFSKAVDKACAVQKEVEKLTADCSDEEDFYFSDDI